MLAVALVLLAPGADPAEPKFTYSHFSRPADKLTATVEKERARFTVASTRGIGGATINLKDGAWPKDVVILLTYADGSGFKNLENFRLSTDRLAAHGSIASSGRVPFAFLDAEGELDPLETGAAGGKLDIKVVKTDKGVELRLPPKMLTGSKFLTLSWIDAHRR